GPSPLIFGPVHRRGFGSGRTVNHHNRKTGCFHCGGGKSGGAVWLIDFVRWRWPGWLGSEAAVGKTGRDFWRRSYWRPEMTERFSLMV
ncbi:MAG: hypothetical protein M0Z41_04705, partial [Peptococcaceae bacterium]|nr:hypothetical protein [Peptococcaceae bacterium]